MKTYRRLIRINGKLHTSPRFNKKSDAEKWYHEMRRKKQFLRDGLVLDDKKGIRFIDYAREWMKKRMANYPASTWMADEQRLRDYCLPFLSEIAMNQITGPQIRNVLLKISEEGFRKEGFKISPETRTRVKALLSAIFGDALNEDPPYVNFNPVLGIKIKEKRTGKKKPNVLPPQKVLDFLNEAKKDGISTLALAATFLMAGPRKQEVIALRLKSVDLKNAEITFAEKYEQASKLIKKGTKGGEEVSRTVPIPKELVKILSKHLEMRVNPESYVFCDEHGNHLKPRDVWETISNLAKRAGVKSNPHALRHTYGREFATNTGNIKALQAILGHSSSSTTDIYSELSGERTKGFGEAVSYEIGVKRSGK